MYVANKIIKYLRIFRQVVRIQTLALVYLHTFLFILFINANLSITQTICLAVLLAVWYGNAVAINDFSDYEVDKINLNNKFLNKERPLLNGTGSKKDILATTIILALLMFSLSFFVSKYLLVLSIFMVILNCIYSLPPIRLSARGVLAQIFLPLGYIVFPAFSVLIVSQTVPNAKVSLFILAMALIFMGRLFLKDFRDEKGDKKTNKLTFLLRHGSYKTTILSAILIIFGMFLSFLMLNTKQYLTLPILILILISLIINFKNIYITNKLSNKLIYIAIVGRLSSIWIFLCTLILLINIYRLPATKYFLLILVCGVMFVSSINWLRGQLTK